MNEQTLARLEALTAKVKQSIRDIRRMRRESKKREKGR
jgi:hypothetical protein